MKKSLQQIYKYWWKATWDKNSPLWHVPLPRYMSILHPLSPRLTTRHSLLVILGIWTLSLVITSPDMAIIQYEANISSGAQCFVCEYNHWNQRSFLNWWLKNQFIIGNLICPATITPCDQSSQEKSWGKEKRGYIFHSTERKTFRNVYLYVLYHLSNSSSFERGAKTFHLQSRIFDIERN